MEGLSEGRIVHFVLDTEFKTLDDKGSLGKIICRPAIIVNAWVGKLEDGMINLQVFLDGNNDYRLAEEAMNTETNFANSAFKYSPRFADGKVRHSGIEGLDMPLQLWFTSVKYSETKETGTWHWPEKA